MDDYAGRVLADRYRLPLPPADEYELAETRAFDTYSGQEVLVRQVPLPEIVEAEVLGDEAYGDGDLSDVLPGGLPEGFRSARGSAGRGGARRAGSRATRRPSDPAVLRAIEAAQAAARIPDHPRLDQVFDVFAEDGSLWIVSELVAARPLAALLADRPLNPFRAAEVAADVVTALRVLHAHGWVHRNITARTVLVCDDGRVMLTGLAAGAAEEALCGYDPRPEEDDFAGFTEPAGAGVGQLDQGEQGDPVEQIEQAGVAGALGPGSEYGASEYEGSEYGGAEYGATGEYGEGAEYGEAPAYGEASAYGDYDAYGEADAYGEHGGAGEARGGNGSRGHAAIEVARSADDGGAEAYGRSEAYGEAGAYGTAERDLRAARAGAIAAYRAGAARAAARVSEAERGAEAGAGEAAGGGGHGAYGTEGGDGTGGSGGPGGPVGHIPDPYGVRERQRKPWHGAVPRAGSVPAQGTPDAQGAPHAQGAPSTASAPGAHGTQGARRTPGAQDFPGAGSAPGAQDFPGARTAPGRQGGQGGQGAPLAGGAPLAEGAPFGQAARLGQAAPPHPLAKQVPPTRTQPAPGRAPAHQPAPGRPPANQPASGRPSSSHPAPGSPSPNHPAPGRQAPNHPAPAGHPTHDLAKPPTPGHPDTNTRPREGNWDDDPGEPRPRRGPTTALAAERARHARMTVVGAVTERWAPEQAVPVHENWQLAAPIGPATDLWGLGALLFRAVQGHAPYPEDSTAELVQLVCAEPPAFAEECGPLRPVVESLLRQDPTERIDFEELSGWLRSLVRSAPEPDAGTHVVPAPPYDGGKLPVVRRRGEVVRKRRAPAPVPTGNGQGHGRHKHKRGRERERGPDTRPVKAPRPERAPSPARPPRSLGRVLLVVILAGLVAAVAYAMLFMPKSEDKADTGRTGNAGEVSQGPEDNRPSPDEKPGGSGGSGEDDGKSPDPDKTPGSQEPQTADPDVAAGFTVRKDTEGFRVAVANGWDRQPKNGRGQVLYTHGGFELLVVPGRDSTGEYGTDPMTYQKEDERELQPFRDSSWATSSGLRRVEVGGRSMAEGQFTWQGSDGAEVFVRNLAMVVDGKYHVVQVRGPEAERDEVTRLFEQASASYRAGN
ncbi:protein kinase [Streptomyces lasiicapitis]|uniref:protein kinase n=1 Tax=Streptomyces lasiicapitis TaxID=1923961 RepID=UPI0033238D8A